MSESRVASAKDVPDQGGLRVQVAGIEIGLFRSAGQYFAIENACPHADFPLHEGTVADCIVTCPAHGFEYDLRTGFSADGGDGFPIPRFAVSERDGELYIETECDDDGELSPRALPRARSSSTRSR